MPFCLVDHGVILSSGCRLQHQRHETTLHSHKCTMWTWLAGKGMTKIWKSHFWSHLLQCPGRKKWQRCWGGGSQVNCILLAKYLSSTNVVQPALQPFQICVNSSIAKPRLWGQMQPQISLKQRSLFKSLKKSQESQKGLDVVFMRVNPNCTVFLELFLFLPSIHDTSWYFMLLYDTSC